MQKIALILLSLALSIYSSLYPPTDPSFEEKIDSFLSSYSKDFDESAERFINSKYNDPVLEAHAQSQWKKIATLKKKVSFKNHYDQKVFQRLFMGFLAFEDAESCESAFQALIDCLGMSCSKVTWDQEIKGMKTTPFIYIKTETEIIFCKIKCEHENPFWKEFKHELIENFGVSPSKIIEAGCSGPVSFNEM